MVGAVSSFDVVLRGTLNGSLHYCGALYERCVWCSVGAAETVQTDEPDAAAARDQRITREGKGERGNDDADVDDE